MMSNQVEWYALLPYSSIQLLIPKSSIQKTFYFNKEEIPLDEAESEIFAIEDLFFSSELFNDFTYATSSARTGFLFSSDNKEIIVTTKVIPKMVSISGEDFKFKNGEVGKKLNQKGLEAFIFNEDTIQILIDLKKLIGTKK